MVDKKHLGASMFVACGFVLGDYGPSALSSLDRQRGVESSLNSKKEEEGTGIRSGKFRQGKEK